MRFTARARLETWAHASSVPSDEETYDLERTVVGSLVAGVTADRCGQCGACDRGVVPVAVGDREVGDMAITDAAYAESQMEIERLRTALENQRRECDRAWREVDMIASERDELRAEVQRLRSRTVTLPPLTITDAMIDAYLRANTAYWTETDAMPKSNPGVWRNGTVREATRVSLEAALRAAGVEVK